MASVSRGDFAEGREVANASEKVWQVSLELGHDEHEVDTFEVELFDVRLIEGVEVEVPTNFLGRVGQVIESLVVEEWERELLEDRQKPSLFLLARRRRRRRAFVGKRRRRRRRSAVLGAVSRILGVQ